MPKTVLDRYLSEAGQGLVIRGCGARRLPADTAVATSGACLDFWGLRLSEEGAYEGRQLGGPRDRWSLAHALKDGGEWSALFEAGVGGRPGHLVLNDYFGFKSVFYAVLDHGVSWTVVLGNSFRVVLRLLREEGVVPRINWNTAVGYLQGRHYLFQTNNSFASPAHGVGLLRADEAFVVSADGVGLVSKERLLRESQPAQDYASLLETGLQKASTGIRSVMDVPGDEHILMLSGGRDSRSVLALAMAAGCEDRLGIVTQDPAIRDEGPNRDMLNTDLRIASGLVERYGLHWAQRSPSTFSAVDFEEFLEQWQKHRSGWNYICSPGGRLSVADGDPRVQLWGAGGELLRSSFSQKTAPKNKAWSTMTQPGTGLDAAAAAFWKAMVPHRTVPDMPYENACAEFVSAFTKSYAEAPSLETLLDDYYRTTRNTAHFGNRNHAHALGSLQWYPLAQPEFLLASKTLPHRDRVAGRTQFDLMERVDPDLNSIEFESSPWSEHLMGEQRSVIRLEGTDQAVARYWEHRQHASAASSGPRWADDESVRAAKKYDPAKAVRRRVYDNLQRLKAASARDGSGLDELFFGGVGKRAKESSTLGGSACAKTESLCDVIEPKSVDHYVVERELVQEAPTAYPGRLRPAFDSLDDRLRTPVVRVTETGDEVVIQVSFRTGESVEGIASSLHIRSEDGAVHSTPFTSDHAWTRPLAGLNEDAATVVVRSQEQPAIRKHIDVRLPAAPAG